MRFLFLGLVTLFINTAPASAYELLVSEVSKPYDIVAIRGDILVEQKHLGQLEDFPIMYEIVVSASTTLTTQLTQRNQGGGKPTSFSLMIVRQNDNDGGVSEVARINPQTEDWQGKKDKVIGLSFWDSELVSREIGPGTYRLEVSTPNNQGRYVLTVGDEQSEPVGYFGTIGQARVLQKFFGLSFLRILTSFYVYYPLGILLLLFGFLKAQRYRKSLEHVT